MVDFQNKMLNKDINENTLLFLAFNPIYIKKGNYNNFTSRKSQLEMYRLSTRHSTPPMLTRIGFLDPFDGFSSSWSHTHHSKIVSINNFKYSIQIFFDASFKICKEKIV